MFTRIPPVKKTRVYAPRKEQVARIKYVLTRTCPYVFLILVHRGTNIPHPLAEELFFAPDSAGGAGVGKGV